MTQTGQNSAARTRDEQVGAIANDWIAEGMGRDIAYERSAQMILEAEARGAEEQRRKDAEGRVQPRLDLIKPICYVDPKYLPRQRIGHTNAHLTMEKRTEQTFALYTHGHLAEVLEALRQSSTNVAALEARVKVLEGVCRHVVWTEEEHGLGSRGHDSAVQVARAALTREEQNDA